VAFVTPTNHSVFPASNSIALLATATEVGGGISSVTFQNGGKVLGVVSNTPYSLTWSNVPAGTYNLYAVAKDTNGASGYASVSITVTNPVVIKPLPVPGSGKVPGHL
jgi:chitinase